MELSQSSFQLRIPLDLNPFGEHPRPHVAQGGKSHGQIIWITGSLRNRTGRRRR
jgi:hypothetical protein